MPELKQDFRLLELDQLLHTAEEYKEKGYRFDQMLAILERDYSITLIYTFVLDMNVVNFKICGIQKGVTPVPSITKLFLAAFVFENEAHDLYGVNIEGNVLDFHGNFYKFGEGVEAPMTIITPEQLAEREKAEKIAAAKKAREARLKAEANEHGDTPSDTSDAGKTAKASSPTAPKMPSLSEEELEKKLANMDPEKAAKVRAAMQARAKKAATQKEGE